MELLVINGHDYSQFVEEKGLDWSRNDLDSDKTTRVKSGKMRRYKITTKRKIGYTLMNMPRAQLAALDDDLSANTFKATYLDLHGKMVKEFYCSSFAAKLYNLYGDEETWGDAAFNMTEV